MSQPPDINGERLMRRLRDLSAIGRTTQGGISRPGFSEAACEANRFVAKQADECGLDAAVDAGGNLVIRRPGTHRSRRTLLVGSHLDTVLNGGWLDGAYGVVAALEVLQVIAERHLDLGFDLAAVAFANEEGALFPQPFWGSMVLAGMLDALPEHPVDYHGNPLGPALARAGGNIDALDTAVWDPDRLIGYLELHIEQGPVLEANGIQVGVVDSIVGRTVLEVGFNGRAAHAGTTPMPGRADALLGAAHLTLAVNRLPELGLCRAATVGRLEVLPNSANTIAGRVHLTVDLRDANPDRLGEAEAAVRDKVAELASALHLRARCERLVRSRPVSMDSRLRDLIAKSANDLGIKVQILSSGAGHDAQILATVTPVGMIFASSIDGVSHVPQENTAPDDLIAGARVLLGTILRVPG